MSKTAKMQNGGSKAEVQNTDGRMTFLLFMSVFISVFGSPFQYGYSTSVVNAPAELMQNFYKKSFYNFTGAELADDSLTVLWSTTVSIYCLGGLIGSLLVGPLASKIGRKGAILFNNIFSLSAAALMFGARFANSYHMIILGRTIVGIHNGLSIGVVPMYLSEISPPNLRGGIGVTSQLLTTIGILVAQILGLEFILGNEDYWHYLMLVGYVIPSGIQLLILPFLPESPRYLLIDKDSPEKAKKVLQKLRGEKDVDAVLDDMKLEDEMQKKEPKMHVFALLKSRALRSQLVCCVLVMAGQQFSGINAIFFYSTSIYEKAGVPKEYSPYATIGTGAINVFMTIVSVLVIDITGRKVLLTWPLVFMTLAFAILTVTQGLSEYLYCVCGCSQGINPNATLVGDVCQFVNQTGTYEETIANLNTTDPYAWIAYLSIVFVILYIIAFAIGLGPIPFIITTEMFRQGARPAAMMLVGSTNWISNFIVGLLFPLAQDKIGAFVFLFFMVVCGLTTAFVWIKVPETKHKTFEEIQRLFGGQDDETGNDWGVANDGYIPDPHKKSSKYAITTSL
ncbi:PREDICTED: solute carrier family 2, facilitated glucose transporter member 5-like [Branchiostoma belcheri]|uniref:Solute carrier family 2, facilitated glucose transporter member 5 n=1 Tax=Branchiostoma belcheri TaxID=7741 RepID=A0A6P4ZLR1_BRABE|nr:PREDICTED: solute carrier family 2, facilitated glucose transporter member 5-like [Branchiostoma belcheri]